jgi:hypothetical protein
LYLVSGEFEFEFEFCHYKTIPEQLFEMGLMPASPTDPKRAIHFGLLINFNAMRDNLGGSGEGMAAYYNQINPNCRVSYK